jgi:regulatory protein
MEGNLNFRQALTRAMALCSKSERCQSEIVAKLRIWELNEDDIVQVLDYLIKEHFLDEERFVSFYVNDKLKFNKWGKIKLSYMLRQKLIPEPVIREALDQINDDQYKKILRDLLKTKIKSIKDAPDFEKKGKLAVFAQSHGFEAELAFRIANELIGNKE